MTHNYSLSFVAQSLDNKSDDFVIKNGVRLATGSEEARQVNSDISRISYDKNKLFEYPKLQPKVTIYLNGAELLIKVRPIEKDSSGRASAVAVHGHLPEDVPVIYLVLDIVKEIREIIENKIKRNIDDKTFETLKKGLKTAFEKRWQREYFFDLAIKLLLGIIIPLLGGLIIKDQNFLSLGNEVGKLIIITSLIAANNVILIILSKLSFISLYRAILERKNNYAQQ